MWKVKIYQTVQERKENRIRSTNGTDIGVNQTRILSVMNILKEIKKWLNIEEKTKNSNRMVESRAEKCNVWN